MRVVEEEVVLTCELHFDIWGILAFSALYQDEPTYDDTYINQNFYTDSLKSAYLLGSCVGILDPKLKRCLSVEDKLMSFS